MNPMGLSAPWSYSLDLIVLESSKNMQGVNPMGHSSPWYDSLGMIYYYLVRTYLLGINPMGLSAPCANSLGIIALRSVKNSRGEPNGP